MTSDAPSREETRRMFLDLLIGRKSREDVASWASTWVEAPDPDVDDPVVWEALTLLCGADLRANPTDYLHDESDFQQWLVEFDDAAAKRPDR